MNMLPPPTESRMSNLINQWLSTLGLAPKPAGQRIFISYRRRDSSGYAGRVADRLVKEFGDNQCFRDVEDIESGTDFVQAIEAAVSSCDALVVVIGPDWLNVRDSAGNRRLDDPRDFVRLEIEAALNRDVRVIPVLVGGADMPPTEQLPGSISRLAFRQATEITDSRWDYDVGRLVATLETMGIPRITAKNTKPVPNYRKRMIAAVAGVVLVVSGAIGGASMVVSSMQEANNVLNSQAVDNLVVPPADNPAPIETQNTKSSGAVNVPARNTPRESAPQPDGAGVERSRILQVLNEGDHTSAEALRTHNTAQLAQYFTGNALVEQLNAVQLLATAGAHIHATFHNRNVQSMRISGDQAVVDQLLEYELEFRDPQEQCLQRIARHNSQQTITLQKMGGGRWLVTHERVATEATPQACY